METPIQQAVSLLARSSLLAICTGAGVSQESGIPTFRDSEDSIWGSFSPQELATSEGFLANPSMVWDWYMQQKRAIRTLSPNPGHYAIAEFEQFFPKVIVITQNIDGFHQRAGSSDVIELHGNIERAKCFSDCRGVPTLISLSDEEIDKGPSPPHCPHCGCFVRPDVVWFGELLNKDEILRAERYCQHASAILLIGTSGTIPPANRLPQLAARRRIPIIEINPHETLHTDLATVWLQGSSGQILPEIASLLRLEAD
jgi:NAD-dependent deacetylase